MAVVKADPHRHYIELSAAAGEADHAILDLMLSSMSITVVPGAGGSASIDTSTRPIVDVEAGNASWIPVDFDGSVELDEIDGQALPTSVTAIRLRAVGQAAKAYLSALP